VVALYDETDDVSWSDQIQSLIQSGAIAAGAAVQSYSALNPPPGYYWDPTGRRFLPLSGAVLGTTPTSGMILILGVVLVVLLLR
jgi:hypothetical protein